MKKLISNQDVELAMENGDKTIYIEKNTIITPLARDIARLNNIEFSLKITTESKNSLSNNLDQADGLGEQLDMKMVYKVFKAMGDKGFLNEILDWLSDKPYIFEGEIGGFQVIRGDTVKFKPFNTGNSKDKVFYQELINKENLSVGLLSMEESTLNRQTDDIEFAYLIEGDMDIDINQKRFTVYPGDILHKSAGSKIVLTSNNKTKLFYVRYKGS